jgi:hypothetical protein
VQAAPAVLRSAAGLSANPPSAGPPVRLAAEFTLEGLTRAWSDLAQVAREQSRFLGEALAAARPMAVEGSEARLAIPDGNPIHVEALGRQREAVERLLTEAVGRAVRITVSESAAEPGIATPPRTRRLSESEARAERLRVLKARDPALEAAAESLDLEVLE